MSETRDYVSGFSTTQLTEVITYVINVVVGMVDDHNIYQFWITH